MFGYITQDMIYAKDNELAMRRTMNSQLLMLIIVEIRNQILESRPKASTHLAVIPLGGLAS